MRKLFYRILRIGLKWRLSSLKNQAREMDRTDPNSLTLTVGIDHKERVILHQMVKDGEALLRELDDILD